MLNFKISKVVYCNSVETDRMNKAVTGETTAVNTHFAKPVSIFFY